MEKSHVDRAKAGKQEVCYNLLHTSCLSFMEEKCKIV